MVEIFLHTMEPCAGLCVSGLGLTKFLNEWIPQMLRDLGGMEEVT